MTPRRRRLAVIAVVLFSGLGLGATELILRAQHLTRRAARDDVNSWHDFDPTLGWRAKPSWSGQGHTPPPDPVAYTVETDAQGFRVHPTDEAPFRVAFVGDSFTFGAGCEGPDTLPAQFDRALGPDASAWNLGTCAYGIGQMRLALEHQALSLEPDLIVLGVIAQNFRRTVRTVSYTGQPKPRFVLREGAPVLVNVPLDPPVTDEDAWIYTDRPPTGGSFLGWKLGEVADRVRVGLAGGEEAAHERWLLGSALIRRCHTLAAERGIPLVVILFPVGKYLSDPEVDPYRALLASLEPEIPVLDLYPVFEIDDPSSLFVPDGHPNAEGHRRSAEALIAFLRARHLLP